MARFYGLMSSCPDLTSVEMKDYNQQLVSHITREDSPAFHRGWPDWIDRNAADPNKTHDGLPFCHPCIADIINTMMYTCNNSSSFDWIQGLKLMPNPVIALACTAVSPFKSSLILQSQLDFIDLGSLGQVVWRQIAIEASIFLGVKVGGSLQGSSSRP